MWGGSKFAESYFLLTYSDAAPKLCALPGLDSNVQVFELFKDCARCQNGLTFEYTPGNERWKYQRLPFGGLFQQVIQALGAFLPLECLDYNNGHTHVLSRVMPTLPVSVSFTENPQRSAHFCMLEM